MLFRLVLKLQKDSHSQVDFFCSFSSFRSEVICLQSLRMMRQSSISDLVKKLLPDSLMFSKRIFSLFQSKYQSFLMSDI